MGHTLQRRRALSTYLDQLPSSGTTEGATAPPFLRAGAEGLALDDWETAALERALRAGARVENDWSALVLESVVVQGKYRDEIERLEAGENLSKAEALRLTNELITDAAIGLALVGETQKAVAAMTLQGLEDDATRLRGFLRKLSESVSVIRERLDPEQSDHAEQLARQMAADPAPAPAARPPAPREIPSVATREGGPAERRRSMLAAQWKRLGELARAAGSGFPVERHPGATALKLDPWEVRALCAGLGPQLPADRPWCGVLAECVAWQARYLGDVAPLKSAERPSVGQLEEIRERLTEDTTVGLALLEELQRAIDGSIRDSKFDEAKRLSAFRNKLGQPMKFLRDRIGLEAFAAAERAAAELVAPLQESKIRRARPAPEQPAEPQPAYEMFTRDVAVAPYVAAEVRPSQTRPLLLVLGVVVAIWAAFIAPRLFTQHLPVLKSYEMPASPAFLEVAARPPSLFIKVKAGVWDEMTPEEREKVVAAVGEQASAAGYTGAHFRSTDGTTVAQWLVKGGVRLYARPHSPS